MKYVIPNYAIKDFRRNLDLTIKCFDLIQLRLNNTISILKLTYTGSLKDDALIEIQSHYLDLVKLTIKTLQTLKKDVGKINTKKMNYPTFFSFVALICPTNQDSNMIILKIISDTVSAREEQRKMLKGKSEIYDVASELETEIAKSLDGLVIKTERLEKLKEAYAEYIKQSMDAVSLFADVVWKDTHEHDEFINNLGVMVDASKDAMQDYVNNFYSKYQHDLEVMEEEQEVKKEVIPSKSLAYTEVSELKQYIYGGIVLHLCAPRTFDELLKRNGYSDNARMSLGKQMKNAILWAPCEEVDALIGNYLASIDVRHQEMWNYLLEQDEVLKQVYLGDIRKYFYALPELGEGYGYTKEDFDYFMIDALKSNYYLAKKHSKALVLLKNGKINEKYGKTAKKFKKIN